MKTKRSVVVFAFCLLVLIWFGLSDAHAVGLGLYGSYGAGSETWKYNEISGDFNKDTTRTGFGLVLDTAVAKDKLINYQLNLGYYQYEPKPNIFKMDGVFMSHDIGFGVVRTENFRLWVGPELKISYFSGSQSSVDYNKVDFGIGPVLGVNLHLGDRVSLALKGGYLFGWGAGNGNRDCKNSSCVDSTFSSNGGEFLINFSVIFRFDDTFGKRLINANIKE